jgi:hypothetical protein
MAQPMPSASDYKIALENMGKTLTLSHLKEYQYVTAKRGGPIIYSGGFAMTCPVKHAKNGDKLALRFFYHLPDDMQERYKAISAFINNNLNSNLFAKIEYHPQGVVVNGKHYPICYMGWLEGDTLRRYVSNNLKDTAKIKPLAEEFRNMVVSLHKLRASHGDLSHENIMVVNGKMMLVDYDGMYVPALNGKRPCLIGQVNFQHPQRGKEGAYFGPYQDDFSAIAIYISLLALQFDPSLYDRYENGGNSLLFRKEDFNNPDASPYFKELLNIPQIADLAEGFKEVCKSDIRKVPSLPSFLGGQRQLSTEIRIQDVSLSALPPDSIFTPEGNPVFAAASPNQERLRNAQGHTGTLAGRVHKVQSTADAVILEFGTSVKVTSAAFVIDQALVDLRKSGKDPVRTYEGQWVRATGPVQLSELHGSEEPTVEVYTLNDLVIDTRVNIMNLISGYDASNNPVAKTPGNSDWRKTQLPKEPVQPRTVDDLFKPKTPGS